MPARARSLQITEGYRSRMIRLRKQGQREANRIWKQVKPSDLDGTFNLGSMTLTVATLQREAARLSSAYLSSFIASELGEPQRPPALNVWDKTFGGNPLREGLRSAVITAKMKIKDGMDPTEATRASRAILVSDVGLFIDTAARESLRQGMEQDDRIVGYQRAVKGTCGACSGDTQYEAFSENAPVVPLNIHPNCQCVAEPVVQTKTGKDAKDYLNAKQSGAGLSLDEAGALSAYQGELSYAYDLNRYLRTGSTYGTKITEKQAAGLIRGIDSAMDTVGPIGSPLRVFRGVMESPDTLGAKVGQTLSDASYASTSLDRKVAAGMSRNLTLYDLEVSPEVKALYVNRVMEGAAFSPGEEEFILQRGCRYVITSVQKRGKGWVVKAKVLPPE